MNRRNPVPVVVSFFAVLFGSAAVVALVHFGLCWITHVMEAAR